MAHFTKHVHRKARKPHRCCNCGGTIFPGTIYNKGFDVEDGYAFTTKSHLGCLWLLHTDCRDQDGEWLADGVWAALDNYRTLSDIRHLLSVGWKEWRELPEEERVLVRALIRRHLRDYCEYLREAGDKVESINISDPAGVLARYNVR